MRVVFLICDICLINRATAVLYVCNTSSDKNEPTCEFKFLELWPRHRFLDKGRNSKTEITRVSFLVCNTSSQYDAFIREVSQVYFKLSRSYGPDTDFCQRL